MLPSSPSTDLAGRVDLSGAISEDLRATALELASRLFAHNIHIDRIQVSFDSDPSRAPSDRFVVKGMLEFGGPALLASVTAGDPLTALQHLIAKFDQLLRRPRR